LEEKTEQKVPIDGKVILPKEWLKNMDIQEGTIIELEYKMKIIKIKKKKHPFEECIGAFDGEEFTEQDHEDAKKALWGS